MEAGFLVEGAVIADDLTHLLGLLGGRLRAWTHARTNSHGALATDIIATPEALAAIAPEWRGLERMSGASLSAFQTYAFQSTWAQRFHGAGPEMRFVTVRDNGKLVLVWPLSVQKTIMGMSAGWAGAPIAQYGDVVMAPGRERKAWLDMAAREISAWGDITYLDFGRVREDAGVAGWLAEHAVEKGEALHSPVLDLSHFNQREWKQQARNEKRLKKLGELGEVRFELVQGARAASLVETAYQFKNEWAARKGFYGSALRDERIVGCLEELARHEGALFVSCLSVGGREAAIEIGFRHGGKHYAFMGAFSPEFARYSPGHLATEMTIRQCVEDGLVQYDPLPPEDEYKLAWSNRRLRVKHYGMVLTFTGLVSHVFSARLRPAMKRLYHRLPVSLRRVLRP